MKKKDYLRPTIKVKTLSVQSLLVGSPTQKLDPPEQGGGGIVDPGEDPSDAKSHSMWDLGN